MVMPIFKRFVSLVLMMVTIGNVAAFAEPPIDCSNEEISALVSRAKNEISQRRYMTLATANSDGNPWNSPLYTAFDSNYSFYWMSEKSSNHSRNLRENQRVFSVLYDSTAPLGYGFGVYMKGAAVQLNDFEQIADGLNLISERAGMSLPPPDHFSGAFRGRVYKFVPSKFWVNTIIFVDGQMVDRRIDITDCMSNGAEFIY